MLRKPCSRCLLCRATVCRPLPWSQDALALLAWNDPEESPSAYLLTRPHNAQLAQSLNRTLMQSLGRCPVRCHSAVVGHGATVHAGVTAGDGVQAHDGGAQGAVGPA